MRVAVLTTGGSRHGLRVLNALGRAGTPPAVVVVVDAGMARKLRLLRRVAARVGWRDALLYAAERQAHDCREQRARTWRGAPLETDHRELAGSVLTVPALGDPSAAEALRGIDLVLLAQSGIVPSALLELPRIGTLNAHPGWLPAYRGIDCHLWALSRGDFDRVGSTLHLVDVGIDTGDIVDRRPYRWTPYETVAGLEARLYEDCIDLLVEGRARAEAGTLERLPQPRGPYCHKLPRSRLAAARENLEDFLARGQAVTQEDRPAQRLETSSRGA